MRGFAVGSGVASIVGVPAGGVGVGVASTPRSLGIYHQRVLVGVVEREFRFRRLGLDLRLLRLGRAAFDSSASCRLIRGRCVPRSPAGMLSTIFIVYAGGAASAGCKNLGATKNTSAKIAACPIAETKTAAKYPRRDGCSSSLCSGDATISAHFAPESFRQPASPSPFRRFRFRPP